MIKKKIFIVEDHPIVIKGLTLVINKQDDLIVCGYATNFSDAITKIEELKPDLVTIDISLKESNGLELIKELIGRDKNLKILVISMFDENIYAERCIQAGAKGYIMKDSVTKELLKAIHNILAGKIYLSDEISHKIMYKVVKSGKDSLNSDISELLSDRELQVFELIGEGLTTNEISERINLGIKSVETYKNKIKEKLELKNFTQLIKKAVEWKLSKKYTNN